MTRIVVDASLRAQLAASQGPVELCSEHGTILGTFQPLPEDQQWRNPPLSEEKIARRVKVQKGVSFAEMVARAEKGL